MSLLKNGYSFCGKWSSDRPFQPSVPDGAVASSSEDRMELALSASVEAIGVSAPNPSVGCLLSIGEQVLASGATQEDGGLHAEAVALKNWKNQARGEQSNLHTLTATVTLEPCSHFGRQPPCAELLIASGVRTVEIARLDPFHQVNGSGIQKLREAGVGVVMGNGWAEATAIYYPFIIEKTLHRPCVALKWAQTLDGALVDATGRSKWITGEFARQYGHGLRRKYDAVMVGAHTFLTDQPQLTVRDVASSFQPLRIVWDPGSKLQGTQAFADDELEQKTPWLYLGPRPLKGALWMPWSEEDAKDLKGVAGLFSKLTEMGIQSLMIEGGPTLLRAWMATDFWDVAHVMVAPLWLDRDPLGSNPEQKPLRSLANTEKWVRASSLPLGDDLLMEFVPRSRVGLFSPG
jgi:diaminohydroxyphosphoribosylaminopyrimidine deaminase/5-amino-6-(5-phosphoribosylamino)uracil reductase